MKEKLKEKRWYICTFIVIFAYRMLRIRGVYEMRVASDDIGMLSGAAYFAGYDWSSVVSTTKYYGIGWYSLFAPILKFVKNPAAIWAVIVIVNICIVALACIFIQYIGIKHLGMEDNFVTSLISIFTSMAVVPSNTLSQESVLFCLTILISYLLMKSLQEEFSSLKRCAFMILAVAFSNYAYLIHTRAVVFLIAIPVAIIFSSLIEKKKIINLASYVISAIILYFMAGVLKKQIIQHIWGTKDSIMNAELPISTSTFQNVFSLKGIKVVFDCFMSNFFTACMRLYGIPCIVILFIIVLLIRLFKKNEMNYKVSENGKTLLVFSVTCFFIGLAGVAVMWGKGAVSTYWTDETNVYYKGFSYFRYYGTFIGPALFVALGERFYNEKYNRRLGNLVLGIYGVVVLYYLLVILRRVSRSEYVNRTILQYVTYTVEGVDILNYILSISLALLVLAVILCAGKYSKYGLILAIAINVIMPSLNSEGLISKPIMGTIGDAGYHLVRDMEENGIEIDNIYCADQRWAYFLQFFLKEKRILVGCPTKEGRTLIFHSNNLREDVRLEGMPDSYECIILDENECVWVSDKDLYDYILNTVE